MKGKVWSVWERVDWEGSQLIALYAEKEDAEAARDAQSDAREYYSYHYDVEELEVL